MTRAVCEYSTIWMIKLFTDPDQTHEVLIMMKEPRKTLRPFQVEKCNLLVYHIVNRRLEKVGR